MAWSASSDWERWDPCQYTICPYNNSHRILASRFQRHLVKCRLNYPDKDFVSCPFNASHQILRPHLRSHICNCLDKNFVEAAYGNDKGKQPYFLKGDTSVPSYYSSNFEHEPDEDWDEGNIQEIMSDEPLTIPVKLVERTKPIQQKSIMSQTREEFKREMKQKALKEEVNQRWGNEGTRYKDRTVCHNAGSTRDAEHEDVFRDTESIREERHSDGHQANTDVVSQRYLPTCRFDDRNKASFGALSSVGRGRARLR